MIFRLPSSVPRDGVFRLPQQGLNRLILLIDALVQNVQLVLQIAQLVVLLLTRLLLLLVARPMMQPCRAQNQKRFHTSTVMHHRAHNQRRHDNKQQKIHGSRLFFLMRIERDYSDKQGG